MRVSNGRTETEPASLIECNERKACQVTTELIDVSHFFFEIGQRIPVDAEWKGGHTFLIHIKIPSQNHRSFF